MKPRYVGGERQGWRGKQQSARGGPQCYAEELGYLYRGHQGVTKEFLNGHKSRFDLAPGFPVS